MFYEILPQCEVCVLNVKFARLGFRFFNFRRACTIEVSVEKVQANLCFGDVPKNTFCQ